MDNRSSAYRSSAGARTRVNPKIRPVARQKDIRLVAAENTASADNSAQINEEIEQESSKLGDKQLLWYALGISVGVVLLGFALVRYKLIKL